MSIPPLVCSTPPPLEQCEEDKDPEDFDIHYNLSQDEGEDEENHEFNYGGFTSFETFQKPGENLRVSYDEAIIESKMKTNSCDKQTEEYVNAKSKICHESGRQQDEDINIEDLNLNVNEETIVGTKIVLEKDEASSTVKDLKDIPSTTSDISENDSSFNSLEKSKSDDVDINIDEISQENDRETDFSSQVQMSKSLSIDNINNPSSNIVLHEEESTDIDNDFEDFDDFQFVGSDEKTAIDITPENPWANNEVDNNFGEFTANFDNCKWSNDTDTANELPTEISSNQIMKTNVPADDDDDFGEFDDFQSAGNIETQRDQSVQAMSILTLHAENESQIIENLNKIIYSIFPEEIPDTRLVLEEKLNGSLGETWGHLKQTDDRQPYIVNWSNSLVQKSLLKALCIDSRNILFGPKWGSSMPKYAINLSVAPLQPQKSVALSNTPTHKPEPVAEKDGSKTSWVDPFKADGEEFTYAEALLLDLEHLMATLDQMAHNQSTLKISELLSHACNAEDNTIIEAGPTDLDVFEATVSKSDKIHSNTLNIQPIRQINLPDTHIYTPTDSETPRSKTIHYDNTAQSILMPQPAASAARTKHKEILSGTNVNHADTDDEYWDFQDFKGSASGTQNNFEVSIEQSKINNNDTIKPSKYTFETQVLQPIKIEPLTPTLNWPDPGEVKETFDDFNDFLTKTLASTDVVERAMPTKQKETGNIEKNFTDQFDDDFDMFQSAMPITTNALNKIEESGTERKESGHIAENSVDFTNIPHFKSEHIPENISHIHPIGKPIDTSSNINEFSLKSQPSPSMPLSSNMLHPAPALVTPSQKTSQILQPLTLESYSQINWPNPGIDLQDLSRFNPVASLQSLKSDSRNASPIHNQKMSSNIQTSDEDIWGEFVSSKPAPQKNIPKKQTAFADDDEWTDFVSSPTVNPQNGLNTISLNVHTSSGLQKSANSGKFPAKNSNLPLEIPTLNYVTPKNNSQNSYSDRHFQNL